MLKIAVFTDSSCDLSNEILERNNIPFVPLIVVFPDENKDYKHRIEITEEEYYKKIAEAKEHPKTSQATGPDTINMFKQLEEEGYQEQLYISISSALSSNYQNANTFKNLYKKREKGEAEITVYDSKQASAGVGLIALKAASLAKQGLPVNEIIEKLDYFKENELKVTFVVENMKYLYKGGRVNALKYTMANLLHIQPCMEVSPEGTLEVFKKEKKYENAIESIIERAYNSFKDKSNLACYIVEGQAQRGLEIAKQILQEKYPDVKVYGSLPLGAVIYTHSGPGTIQIDMFKDFEH